MKKKAKINRRTPLYGLGKVVAQPFVRPFIPYIVKGRENVPLDRNFILCSNHLGISDPLRLASIERRQIYFLSKAELFRNKPLAWLLRSLGCIPVQRGRGELGQPKAGAVMLAHQHNVPIIPVCITPVGSKRPKLFHRAVVSYGELITPEELGIHEGKGVEYRTASRIVMGKIAEMRERDLKELAG